jgi:hypothetical protein
MGDAERDFQAGAIFPLFNRGDGLPRNANTVTKFGLCHLIRPKTQGPNVVAEGKGHGSIPPPVIIKLGTDAHHFCQDNSRDQHIKPPGRTDMMEDGK